MKTTALISLFASLAAASPVLLEQQPFEALNSIEPGFSLDLNAQRLVEMQGKPPVWMSELDKARISAIFRTPTLIMFH